MKKFLLFCIVLISSISFAQEKFENKWKAVDSLELQGRNESAAEIVLEILKEARESKDYNNFIKAKLFYYKFYQVHQENSNEHILADLEHSISKLPAPHKNIMLSYKASFLEQYLNSNRWSIRDRTQIDNPEALEIETWSAATLQDSIAQSYKLSLQNEQKLIETSAGNTAALLVENLLYRKYQPSLYDILAHRALAYFSDSGNFQSVNEFAFDNEALYGSTSEFSQINFPQTVKESPEVSVLKIYQNLENLHAGNENLEAFIFNQLERLDYVKTFYKGDQKFEKYLEALDRLNGNFEQEPARALILFAQAMHYYEQSEETNEESELKHPGFLKNAVDLCDKIIEGFPNSATAQNAYRLKSSITAAEINAKVQEILSPQKPGRIYVSYKNLDSIELKIYKVPESFQQKLTYRNQDSIIKNYSEKKPFFRKFVHLPKSEDYNLHSTEFAFPGLEKGNYLLYISVVNPEENQGFTFEFIQVSNLVLAQTRFDKYALYRSIDRTSGKNISGAKIEFFYDNKKISRTGKTDKYGELKDNLSMSNRRSGRIRISKNGDTLNTNYWSGYYNQNEEKETILAKSMLYLDRAIYRPGQKVFFKGVLLQYKNKQTSTVPGEFVEVYVDDANGEEIQNFKLKTNKYGSFNGEFTLPSTGITGAFKIYTEENIDDETEFWKTLGDSDGYVESGVSFNVEEYKRPTFEVVFDTIKQTFRPKDTIEITGNVSSFMGAKLNNTALTFEVYREKRISYWWRDHYTEKTLISTDSLTTTAEGNFSIKFLAEVKEEDLKEKNLIYRYSIKATVTDVSGETRDAQTSLKIGNKNLLVNLEMLEGYTPLDSLTPSIRAVNLNDNPVAVNGKLRIYKLQAPKRILQERLWEAPEITIIPEEEFKELFPEEPYEAENKPENWSRGKLQYETVFNTDNIYEPKIPINDNWESGKYVLELEVEDGNNTDSIQRTFNIIKPEDDYLPDKGRFDFSVKNSDFRKDKRIEILLQTAYKNLHLEISAFNKNEQIFREFVKLDGKELIEIPLKDAISETVEIRISGVKNNSLIQESRRISIPIRKKQLKIETETFRNKIEPGVEETWSFKVTVEKDEIPDAELLASMYDASLDQFKLRNWETEAGFSRTYLNFPSFNISNIGGVGHFSNRFSRSLTYRNQKKIFDDLDLFGFYFSEPNSYEYRQYLSRKKRSGGAEDLLGNTRGKITDINGLPLPGVNVTIKGTGNGTQTNFDGEFALDTKAEDILVISYLGFGTYEYRVGETKELFVIMEEDSSALNEVVTVGYGSQVQGEVVGSANGLRIRGNSSLNENAALFIVDGKMTAELDIDPSDVLSVETLEGAEATALYGARAANGVMIITTKKGMEDLQNVEARKNLDETAFFLPELNLDKNGKLQFSFTSPEALTRWKLRLLGHTREWATGQYENTIVTQKELNIIPNPPRFLRENDTILFKSKITNLSRESISGTAMLQLFDAITMKPIDTLLGNISKAKNFNLKASASQAVAWDLIIPEGVQAVNYKVLAKAGDFTDGEENLLPVLTNRMLVKESLAFFVRAGETENYEFKNLKENTSSTLEHHKFSLEYTSNPAWYAVQSLPYLMEFEHECSEQNFARLYANSLASHIMNSQPKIKEVFEAWRKDNVLESQLEKNEELKLLLLAETPWLRDAQSETSQKQRIAKLFELNKLAKEKSDILKRLKRMQNNSGAFPWFSGGRDNNFITRHIVAGFGHLKKMGVEIDDSAIIKNAISYLDKEMIENRKFYDYQDNQNFYKSTNSLHYLYARSYYLEEFPLSEENQEIAAKIIEVQKESWLEASLYNKGLLMLIFSKMNEKKTAENIMVSLKESAVKSKDYGMYWKENKSGWHFYSAPVETQALLIEAFSELENLAAVEEMKIWLLQNKRTNHWPTTKATTEATYALLMQGEDWLQTEDNTQLSVGGKEIPSEKLEETAKEAGTGYRKISWTADEINDSFSEITVENNNNTAGFGGAYWQYFEDLDKIKIHNNSPLNVEKELYLNVSGTSGKSLNKISAQTPIKTGDLVTVRLVVRSKADMDYIHLKDMRASGFEPTNVLSEYKYQDGTAYYESTRDAATHFFFDSLNKGTYVLEYTVRANNSGKFSNGITTIESMYAPEFSSHTKGIRVKIQE
ncbi:carboxypeptidase-like regulatory domain-containing protein [Salegentibacter sp. LM13S]|uniref:alpha-2-macroglobulin family protein n=1 Tax=Salegentibacter lacus TaxID=2873599 RepID=UPI001CCC12AA|nr:MG2 domain-containing protein [Salegentibacter lacus]MBZ9629508.1 carboxypeptidase-like regulatory domain-containing protein [Salegentibacter lacus]